MTLEPRFARRALALAAVACLCTAAPSLAQRARPDRPYRGLFGGNGANPRSSQQLDMSLSFSGAYDGNVLAEQGQSLDPRFQKSGGYGGGSLSLDYTKKAGRAAFDFSGGTSYRYYPSLSQMNGFNSWASAGLSARLSPATSLGISENASYSPFYSFGTVPGVAPAPGDIAPINPDNPLIEDPAVMSNTSVSIDQRLGSRSSLAGNASYSFTHYSRRDLPYRNLGAGGHYSYRLTPRANFSAGYSYSRGVSGLYAGSLPIETHNLDLGFSYSKRVSPSRTMVFGATVGPSVYRNPVATTAGTDVPFVYQTRYPVHASAFVTRQIARSWSLGVNFSRGQQYTSGFNDALWSNSLTGTVSGFASSRANVSFSAGYTTGTVGYGASGRGYDTATAAAKYQFALNSWIALSANYSFYHYFFDTSVVLPANMPRGQDRNSITGGVNLWLPLLR